MDVRLTLTVALVPSAFLTVQRGQGKELGKFVAECAVAEADPKAVRRRSEGGQRPSGGLEAPTKP